MRLMPRPKCKYLETFYETGRVLWKHLQFGQSFNGKKNAKEIGPMPMPLILFWAWATKFQTHPCQLLSLACLTSEFLSEGPSIKTLKWFQTLLNTIC